MTKSLRLLAAVAIVLAVPVLLRQGEGGFFRPDETLVVITPHNEATRFEFARAFAADHLKKTGRRVRIDWRTPGGTSEIARYLASEYLAAFQNEWTNRLGRTWSASVESAFDNPKTKPDGSPGGLARRAFLASDTGCGIDLFFGGGVFDYAQQAAAGRLVDCGVAAAHPEWFNDSVIPQSFGGEQFWDAQGRWLGVCLSAFGICHNPGALARLKIGNPPAQWGDLADPRYFGSVALADPTQSGSVAKAFEMLIQQRMQEHEARRHAPESSAPPDLSSGWEEALRLIQRIAANARYFTDSATKIPYDVAAGDAAAGMCVDFYGRFQSESARVPGGFSRLQYLTPSGGSSVGADPIGLLRGAPNPRLAREFIEFVLSVDGQKLWNWKTGAPGGPEKYGLRRLPIRRDLYAGAFRPFRSDPDVNPYEQAGGFVYREQWTGPLFRAISFVIRAMCIDPHDELRQAWRALIDAGFPPDAMAVFQDVSQVGYANVSGPIREALRSGKKIDQMRLATELSEAFRAQYLRAADMARRAGSGACPHREVRPTDRFSE